jgi:hypothetical protein
MLIAMSEQAFPTLMTGLLRRSWSRNKNFGEFSIPRPSFTYYRTFAARLNLARKKILCNKRSLCTAQ